MVGLILIRSLSDFFYYYSITKLIIMTTNNLTELNGRRRFLSSLATGAAAISLSALPSLGAQAENNQILTEDDPDAWFNKIKGKHRIMYDVTHPNEIFPFAWPRVFLLTNGMTGTPEKDCNV